MPKDVTDESSHSACSSAPIYVSALSIAAVIAALARDAGGVYLMAEWIAWPIQAGSCAAWVHHLWINRRVWRDGARVDFGLTATGLLAGGCIALWTGRVDALAVTMTSLIAGLLLVEFIAGFFARLQARMDRPAEILRVALRPWLCLIVITTILLAIPLATRSGVPDFRHNFWLHIANSAFNAVSAAGLVGTSTYGFGTEYALFGQAVIVVTTQLAGFLFAAMGLAMARPFLKTEVRLGTVFKCIAAVEVVAIAVVWTSWHDADAGGMAARAGWGLTHVGSAIFNSGWTLRADGLATYFNEPRVYSVVALLSVVGSIGLPILIDLTRRSPATNGNSGGAAPWKTVPQMEAAAALILLVSLAGFIWVCEAPRFMPEQLVPRRPVDFGGDRVCLRDDMGHRQRWTMSVFISSTLRSAGLQSTPLSEGATSWPTYLAMLGMMALGGSVGGVAGGMRVSALLIPLLVIFSGRLGWASRPGGMEARRCLLTGAARIAAVMVLLNVGGVLTLSMSTDGTWYERVFDGVAAVSNVGLSTGLALHLTSAGRLAMMLCMVAGRLVPIIMWLNLVARLQRLVGHHPNPEPVLS